MPPSHGSCSLLSPADPVHRGAAGAGRGWAAHFGQGTPGALLPLSRPPLPAFACLPPPCTRSRAAAARSSSWTLGWTQYAGDRYETAEQQVEFERNIFAKTKGNQARSDPDIILLNKQVVVYMFATDVYFYVAGDQNENELILSSVLTAFYETMDAMLR